MRTSPGSPDRSGPQVPSQPKRDTPLAAIRDLYEIGRLRPPVGPGERVVSFRKVRWITADGTLWTCLPVVERASGERFLLAPLAWRVATKPGRPE